MLYCLFIYISLFQLSWTQYSPAGENFTFNVPSSIQILKGEKEILSSSGPLNLVIYKSQDNDEFDNSFTLSFIDYGSEVVGDRELQDSIIQETIYGLPGELIYEQVSQKLGKIVRVARKKMVKEKLYSKSYLFFDAHRFYIMLVYTPEENSLNENIDRFLNSFRK